MPSFRIQNAYLQFTGGGACAGYNSPVCTGCTDPTMQCGLGSCRPTGGACGASPICQVCTNVTLDCVLQATCAPSPGRGDAFCPKVTRLAEVTGEAARRTTDLLVLEECRRELEALVAKVQERSDAVRRALSEELRRGGGRTEERGDAGGTRGADRPEG